MLAMGLFASWAGTLAWSRASKLLPTSLTGQLIVFETLSALAYGFVQRGQWPGWVTAGIGLLVGGVMLGVRAFQRPPARGGARWACAAAAWPPAPVRCRRPAGPAHLGRIAAAPGRRGRAGTC
jgi:hypothetical protein